MSTYLRIPVNDDTLHALQARADAIRADLEQVAEKTLRAGLSIPLGQRSIGLTGDVLETLEKILGGGSVVGPEDLQRKVERLAGISFRHVRLPFTPGQLEALKEKADRQGLTVEQLVERTAPRIYEQFFDLVVRS